MKNSNSKFGNILGKTILIIILFFPLWIPAIISVSLETIFGLNFAESYFFSFKSPTGIGWMAVLGIYAFFYALFCGIRYLSGGINFIAIVGVFIPALILFFTLQNLKDLLYTPFGCSIITESHDPGVAGLQKSMCYYGLAITPPYDVQYCQMIPDENEKMNCIQSVGYGLRDASLCDKITNKEQKRLGCWREIGKFQSEKKCYNIGNDQAAKDTCLLLASKEEKGGDLTICKSIDDIIMKTDCYIQVLIAGGTKFSCDDLMEPILIKKCYDDVEKGRINYNPY